MALPTQHEHASNDHAGHGWSIRPAVDAELAQIVLLERETSTAPHWAWADYAPLLHSEHTAAVRRSLFVAADGRVVHGFAVGKIIGFGPHSEAELESVVVQAAMRRQGLGSALCRAVMDWARADGAHNIALEVRAGSARALKLYGGLGFVAVGRRPRYYQDPAEDAILMHCAIGSAPAAQSFAEADLQPALF